MAEGIRNVYELLEDDGAPANGSPSPTPDSSSSKLDKSNVEIGNLNVETSDSAASGGAVWTDVSREKRRLVPQYSLSKEVMGLESVRNRAPATNAPSVADTKKKGILHFKPVAFVSIILTVQFFRPFSCSVLKGRDFKFKTSI